MASGRRASGILLDADGTLWDTPAAMVAAGSAAAQALWPDLTAEQARGAGVRFRTDPTGAFGRFVAGGSTFEQMRAARVRDVGSFLGRDATPAERERFEAAYAPVFDASLTAYRDAAPFLEWCGEQGLPVRVLTNSSAAYTAEKVLATGLTSLAGAVCSRDCLGVGKPDPTVFRHACGELGTDPATTVFVGDELVADALGAHGAGLWPVWLVREQADPALEVGANPERLSAARERGIEVVRSLADVPALLVG